MDDLISRQAAIDRIRGTGYADQIKENIIIILMCLPSAQPEIVRCKDCKFGNISSMGHLAVCGHEKGLVDPVPDSYCSFAERRTDD